MERFHVIDDAAVIIRSRGVYRQCKVYRRGNDLYAARGAGFVKLYAHAGTSCPNVSWDDIDLPFGMTSRLVGHVLQVADGVSTRMIDGGRK